MKKTNIIGFLILIIIASTLHVFMNVKKFEYQNENYYSNNKVMTVDPSESDIEFNNLNIKKLENRYHVIWANKEIYIHQPEVDLGAYIKEVSLSPNSELMAVTINDISQTKVLIVNLITEQIIFDGYKTDFEIIDNPVWGPDNELCFIVGSICDLKPAIFDLKTNNVKIIPTDTISEIVKMKWSIGGDFIDYCFNNIYDEDSFKFYRYDIKTDKSTIMDTFTKDDFLKWSVEH